MGTIFFYNGTILTQDPAHPQTDALLVGAGRIVALGSEALRLSQAAGVRHHDLLGRTLMPAFSDPHIHLWKVGDLMTYMLDLRGVRSIVEMQEKLRDFAEKNPKNPWILARGFNEALFPDGQMPDFRDLDAAVPDRPVQVIRTCAHIAVLNSVAMQTCGITADTQPPPGGELRRNAQGQPTGVLSESALGLPKAHIPPHSAAAYRDMILAAQDALLRCGIATATDPAVHPELLEVYRQMASDGELRVRVHAIPIRIPDGDTQALPLPPLYRSDFLRVDTVKFFADGGLSGQTAALHGTYKNSTERGVLRLDPEYFFDCALEAQSAGFRIATHAIGDRAIDLVLDVYERLQTHNKAGLRHRIEHLGLPTAAHLARMRSLGVHCVTQPIFLYELGTNFRNYLVEKDLARVYPYRSVLEAGVSLAFSSDAPVVRDFAPLMGIRNAVERKDNQGVVIGASEKVSVAAALYAYTQGAADANGEGTETGSLTPGKRADLIILSRNPLLCTPEEISGIVVYGADQNASPTVR